MNLLTHYDDCHIQVRRDYFLLCAYDRAGFNQKKTKNNKIVKDEPDQECMAKILRVFETLTDHRRNQWLTDAAHLGGMKEPEEYPLYLSYGAIYDLLYQTHSESAIRNSIAVLLQRGYITQHQPSKNKTPYYVLNIGVLQEALKQQAKNKLLGVACDSLNEGTHATPTPTRVLKSNARVSRSTADYTKTEVSGVACGQLGVAFDTNKNKSNNLVITNKKEEEEPPTSPNDHSSSMNCPIANKTEETPHQGSANVNPEFFAPDNDTQPFSPGRGCASEIPPPCVTSMDEVNIITQEMSTATGGGALISHQLFDYLFLNDPLAPTELLLMLTGNESEDIVRRQNTAEFVVRAEEYGYKLEIRCMQEVIVVEPGEGVPTFHNLENVEQMHTIVQQSSENVALKPPDSDASLITAEQIVATNETLEDWLVTLKVPKMSTAKGLAAIEQLRSKIHSFDDAKLIVEAASDVFGEGGFWCANLIDDRVARKCEELKREQQEIQFWKELSERQAQERMQALPRIDGMRAEFPDLQITEWGDEMGPCLVIWFDSGANDYVIIGSRAQWEEMRASKNGQDLLRSAQEYGSSLQQESLAVAM